MPSNVFNILSYGVIGLGFLLAFLSYKLLLKEQSVDAPRKSVLQSIYIFMLFSLVLCCFGIVSQLWPKSAVNTGNGSLSLLEKADVTNLRISGHWIGRGQDIPLEAESFHWRNNYIFDLTIKQDENDYSRVYYSGEVFTIHNDDSTKRKIRASFSGCGKANDLFLSCYYDLFTHRDEGKITNGFGSFFLKFLPMGDTASGYCTFRDTKTDGIGMASFNLKLQKD